MTVAKISLHCILEWIKFKLIEYFILNSREYFMFHFNKLIYETASPCVNGVNFYV